LEVSKPINLKFLENPPISKTVSTQIATTPTNSMTPKHKTSKAKTEKPI
jgi:hypothetical protein